MRNVNVNINISVKADTVRQFVRALKELEDLETLVGVPEEHDARDGSPASNALIAYVQNFGCPAKNIPARPFMEPGIKDKEEEIVNELHRAGEAVFDGVSPKQGLQRVGLIAQQGIQNKIASNIPPKLKKSTIKARRRRGRTGTMTLQDTGQLRNAITYVVRKRAR